VATARPGKRSGGPWYGDERERLRYEGVARRHLPTLRGRTIRSGKKSGRVYSVHLEIPYYEARTVEVLFQRNATRYPIVTADDDGPSPHRYDSHRLCLWTPRDPPEQTWLFDDGLLALLGLVTTHLFREGWWRETGEWLGPESPHGSPKDSASLA
jgi:hypothetical protein